MLELAMTEGMLFVVVILLLCVDNGTAQQIVEFIQLRWTCVTN